MSNSNNNYSEQIDRLTEQLHQLRLEFNTKSDRIINEINQLREDISESRQQDDSDDDSDHIFALGNYVEITNNYQGLKGTKGYIAKITEKQVILQDEKTREFHKRSKTNVRKVVSNRRQHR
jgi:hypothetical protein